MKLLCKKNYIDIDGIILEKGTMYTMKIQYRSIHNDTMYDRLSVYKDDDSNTHVMSIIRCRLNYYFYTKQEVREQVINELLKI